MNPGKKLALARRYHQPALTQQGLAELLEVDRATVARWESSGTVPVVQLERVSAVIGIPVEWFVDGLPDAPPLTSPGNIRPSRSQLGMGKAGLSLGRGDEVVLAVWRGVLAGDGECEFWPSDGEEYRALPAFLTGGEFENHVLCIASGLSMAPRIDHAERVVVRLDPDPPLGAIVVARRPDGANFIKVLRRGHDKLELHSLNADFAPILELRDWALKGYVVAILHTYGGRGANIEWDEGRPLRS